MYAVISPDGHIVKWAAELSTKPTSFTYVDTSHLSSEVIKTLFIESDQWVYINGQFARSDSGTNND